MYESRDVGNIARWQIELRHAFVRPPIANHRGNQFSILVAHYMFASHQIRTTFAASRVWSMAETTIHTENLTASRDSRGIAGRSCRIIWNTTSGSRRLRGGGR